MTAKTDATAAPREDSPRRPLSLTWIVFWIAIVVVASPWIALWTGAKWTEIADLAIKVGSVIAAIYVYMRHERERHDLDVDRLKQQISQQEARHDLDVQLLALQGQAAVDRGKLALNVDLRAEATPHSSGYLIRATVTIRNASSKPFRVPAVYITGRLVPARGVPARPKAKATNWELLSGCQDLRTRNAANYETVMVQLAPEESEQFTTWFHVASDVIADHPSVVIQADVVGAEETKEAFADAGYRARFLEWMSSHEAHDYQAFRSWPKGMFGEYTKDGVTLPAGRCLMEPPKVDDRDPDVVDIESSKYWHAFLDADTMMWDRYVILPLGVTQRNENASTPIGVDS